MDTLDLHYPPSPPIPQHRIQVPRHLPQVPQDLRVLIARALSRLRNSYRQLDPILVEFESHFHRIVAAIPEPVRDSRSSDSRK